MARLIMLSGKVGGASDDDDVTTVEHPRTGRPVQGFGLRKIVLWNSTGTMGSALKGLGSNDDIGTYGVIEFFDEYYAAGGENGPAGSNKVMRIAVSGKSRLVLELPGDGMYFREGIRVAIASDPGGVFNKYNRGDNIYYQLVGYEY